MRKALLALPLLAACASTPKPEARYEYLRDTNGKVIAEVNMTSGKWTHLDTPEKSFEVLHALHVNTVKRYQEEQAKVVPAPKAEEKK